MRVDSCSSSFWAAVVLRETTCFIKFVGQLFAARRAAVMAGFTECPAVASHQPQVRVCADFQIVVNAGARRFPFSVAAIGAVWIVCEKRFTKSFPIAVVAAFGGAAALMVIPPSIFRRSRSMQGAIAEVHQTAAARLSARPFRPVHLAEPGDRRNRDLILRRFEVRHARYTACTAGSD